MRALTDRLRPPARPAARILCSDFAFALRAQLGNSPPLPATRKAMSFTLIENAPARLNRSELAVPGSQPQFFDKAAKGTADVVFLDLEDAVAPDEKEKARRNIVQALNEIDWRGRTMSLRINGLDTHYMYRDVVDVLEQAPGKLDLIMI